MILNCQLLSLFLFTSCEKGLIPSRGNDVIFFLFTTVSRLALGPTQPPIHWVLGGPYSRGMKLTTYLHLVLRLRMCGAVHQFPQYVFMAWCLIMVLS